MSREFAIIGFPLKHTMSPPIHKKLFELSKSTGDYNILEISPENLSESIQKLNSLNGYNVTIPHKVSVIPFIDNLDISAKRYGAVNCVFNKDGVSTGYNTDCYGFLRSLSSSGLSLKGNVLLLGCGGAGRMMAMETVLNGGKLTIAVRKGSEEKALSLKNETGMGEKITITTLDNIEGHFDILINSTPVGMYPHIDECPVSDDVISNCDAVFDAIYNPKNTVLVKKFIEQNKKAVGGMAMLVWQAVVAHEIWDNAKYNDSDINALISEMEREVEEKFR